MKYVHLKLNTGQEILGVYIKRGLCTIEIQKPISITSLGNLFDPKLTVSKFTLLGDWDRVKIHKSSIVAELEPIPELIRYYDLLIMWIDQVMNPNIIEELTADTDQLSSVISSDMDSPEAKQRFYARFLEGLQFTKESMN